MPAHRAEVRVDIEILVVIRARQIGIERELEVALPVERGARLGELVVAVARAGNPERHIGRVRRDLVRNAALLHVVLLRESEVLLRRHVAEHRGAVISGRRRADRAGDVVVAGEHVRNKRPEHVERRAVTEPALQLHVVLDLVERHVARAFDHHLHAVLPSALGEFAERFELCELRRVRRVGEPARAQAVTDRERHVVAPQDLADVVPERVHRVLLAVRDHPLREQRAAARDDAN